MRFVHRLAGACFAALITLAPGSAPLAAPFLWPATPDGPAEVRDELDTAPYLGAWKAQGLRQSRALATPPTANQLAYDVTWYSLDLAFTPATAQVAGSVRTKARVVDGPISTLELDLAANMVVDQTRSGALVVSNTHVGDLVTLTLERPYATNEIVDVTVTYHGSPAGGYFGFPIANGRQLIWSLSEAFGARTWWPCKDANEDKADSVDVRFTVPTGLITASNGTLVSSSDNGTVAITQWKERYPIVPYLVSIASYPYTTATDWYRPTPTDSMPISFYMFPESVIGAAPVHAKVKNMLATFAQQWGEYPFVNEKYGHAQFTFGGGMEHQTCTSLGVYNESVVAHELGHQWWGDHITCRTFHHIWLNEGFATYSEAVWSEANGGAAAYHADIDQNRFFGPGTVYVPSLASESRIFDSNLSYNKGSWVLHMLRHVLGDATFLAALQQYYTQFSNSTATTEDFRDVCEVVSGRDLDAFFAQWIYGEYYPAYRLGWSSAPGSGGGHDVTVTLDQTQTWQLFNMPLDLRITTTSGDQTFVVRDSLASQTFVLHVADAPLEVALDPDGWVLKTVESVVANPTFQKSVLVVNGVDWPSYGSEITSAYTDKAFWGSYGIDFWDAFQTPAGGYPGTLPAPLGHGAVPASVIGQYRNVVWVGNNLNGDLAAWFDTPIRSYMKAGGNVLLMTRSGEQFLLDSLRSDLGITFTNTNATLNDCLATRPGFTSMTRLGTQSLCAAFDTVRSRPDTDLLFRVASGFTPTRGIGVVRRPVGGAGSRPTGGRFAFLSGRPYRWNHAQLASNVERILSAYFLEPVSGVDAPPAPAVRTLALSVTGANPFRASATLRFELPNAGDVRLSVYDASGRRVRTLAHGTQSAGPHVAIWDGLDDAGHTASAGLYWARLETREGGVARKLVRVR